MKEFENKTEAFGEGNKKNRMILRLNESQMQKLKNGTIGLSGLLAGAAGTGMYFTLISSKYPEDENGEISATTAEEGTMAYAVETELPVADVSDTLSFNDAFAEAREEVGVGGFFEWRGNTYNTYYKEEWNALTTEEKEDYLTSIEKATETETIPVETVNVTVEEELPELEPIVGVQDLNDDGVIDAVAIDHDMDGFADVFAVDVNDDGYADGVALNTDLESGLDVLIIDEGQDGFDDHVYAEKTEGIVSMDDFIIIDEDAEENFADDDFDMDTDPTEFTGIEDMDLDDLDGPEI